MELDTIASFLEAAGTISAVLVALFIGVYLDRRRRPRLRLEFNQASDDVVVTTSPDGSILELWVRVRVLAAASRRTATNTQVRLVDARRVGADGPTRVPVPTGSMIWSSEGPAPQSLLSGMWRHVDILRYRVRDPRFAAPQLEVEVGYEFQPDEKQSVIQDEGRYELEFLLGADDGTTSSWRLAFDHQPNKALDAATFDPHDLVVGVVLQRLS